MVVIGILNVILVYCWMIETGGLTKAQIYDTLRGISITKVQPIDLG